LGLAFKNGTDDCRTSPAITIVREILKTNGNITVYDPKALASARQLLGNSVTYAENAYEAVKKADVVTILTEWDDFKRLNWEKIAELMRNKVVVDLRNILDEKMLLQQGFEYHRIGKI